MRYRNPEISEIDIEEKKGSELAELTRLLLSVLFIIAVTVFIIDRMVYFCAPYLPFSWEVNLAQTLHIGQRDVLAKQQKAVEAYLQTRINALTHVMHLPPEMQIQPHYVDSATVNAYATIGGNLFVMRGILTKLKTQEALDAVLAHEIAHVQQRHIARQMSRAILFTGLLSAARLNNASVGRWLLGNGSQLGMLAYSRSAETESDEAAIQASLVLYGHSQGMIDVMQTLAAEYKGQQPNQWLSSHPDTQQRIVLAQQAQPKMTLPALHPLPEFIQQL